MKEKIEFHSPAASHFLTESETVHGFILHNYKIALHTHDFYEINIILSGSGTHQIKDTSLSVRQGNVFVIPPSVPHAYYDTDKLEVFHILVRPDLIRNNMAEASGVDGFLLFIEIEPYLRASGQKPHFLRLSQKQLLLLKEDLDIIADTSPYHTPQNEPLVQHTLWKMLYTFSVTLANQTPSKNKYEEQILDTLEYIHKNYGERITDDLLCKRVFLSRSTFLRSFAAMCGCTPTQYLSRYRLEKVLDMMENTSLSKTEIARSCGYYDLSHMERAMKK